MDRLSLRLRVFLFFAVMGLGGAALVFLALWAGYLRAPEGARGFWLAATLSGFALVALAAGLWLLFDEHVAKPVEQLAAQLRVRAHAGVTDPVDPAMARYLGDLGPAAQAVTDALSAEALQGATRVATETERLATETARLSALLTEIPLATMILSAKGRIVLYDGQAASVLATQGAARLNARADAYFDAARLAAARDKLARSGLEQRFDLATRDGALRLEARLKPLEAGAALLVLDHGTAVLPPDAARPLVYDFTLLEASEGALLDQPLSALSFCVFDTETTGLLPHKDEIVQIGAVRVLGGRIVPSETLDMLVDPGRPIPETSRRVHGINDAMVAGKPGIAEAGRALHHFAEGSVMVAHNAPFDMAFLHRHKDAMGVVWEHPVLDTVLLSAVLFGVTEDHRLEAICARLGVMIPHVARHSALGDAQATAAALCRMVPMLEARGLGTLAHVLDETRRHGRLLQDLN